jgi:hypothetical protein
MQAKQTYADEIREEVFDFDRNYGAAYVAIPTTNEEPVVVNSTAMYFLYILRCM